MSRNRLGFVAAVVLAAGLALPAIPALAADDWVNVATVSPTSTLTPNALCYTDGRDIACDGTAGLITAPNTSDRIVSGTSAAVIGPDGTVTMRGLLDIVTGTYVVGVGQGAAQASSGTRVTAVGYVAAQHNSGDIVTALGGYAGYNNSGNNLTALGYVAGQYNTGNDSTLLGYYAGRNNSGVSVTALGYKAGISNTFINATLLGSGVYTADKANQVVLGDGSVVEVSTSGVYAGTGVSASGTISGTNGYFPGNVGMGGALPGSFSSTLYVSSINSNNRAIGFSTVVTDTTGYGIYGGVSPWTTTNGTTYSIAGVFTNYPNVLSGISQAGYSRGVDVSVLRRWAQDEGTLATLYGETISYGHYTGVSTGRTTTNAYGLYLYPYANNGTINNLYDLYIANPNPGGTVGQHYAVYQQDANATNYFAGKVGIGVVSPSAAVKLEVAGTVSATKFVGDGSGLTGLAAGTPSEIASGTTKVSTNSNGYISLTTGGTTTGYLDTAGKLIVPGVSVTTANGVSSTNGYFSGKVGIGTNAPTAPLHISSTSDGKDPYIFLSNGVQSRSVYLSQYGLTIQGVSNNGNPFNALTMIVNGSFPDTGTAYGLVATGLVSETASAQSVIGSLGRGYMQSSGNVTNLVGVQGDIYLYGAGATGQVQNAYALYAGPLTLGGGATATVSNSYGVYIRPRGVGTTRYGVYQVGPDANYFGGNIGIGSTNPANVLDLGAATSGRGIAWSNNGQANYNNIWGAYGRASLVLANGLRGGTSNDDYYSSYDASSGRAAIRLNGVGAYNPGSIQFFTDAPSAVNSNTTIVPTERMRIATTGVGIGLQTPTTALEVSGTVSATKFVGDGSGLTGIATGTPDRITSGTTGMYTYNNDKASIATAGVERIVVGTTGEIGIAKQPTVGVALEVSGMVRAATSTGYSVVGMSTATFGGGVYGSNSAATGPTSAVYGQVDSINGSGLYGYASAATGSTRGVYGYVRSTSGTGVYGYAWSPSGFTYGVYGWAESPDGYGVYSNGNAHVSGTLTVSDTVIAGSFVGDGSGLTGLAAASMAIDDLTDASSSVALGSVFLGSGAGTANTGTGNTGVGIMALASNTTGGFNVANGTYALYNNTTASGNVATGNQALYTNTTGSSNVANGYKALYSNTTGNSNMANGYTALSNNTTGSNNAANGTSALYSNTTGFSNVANGTFALYHNTNGSYNVASGYTALYNNTTGLSNVANGANALYNNTTGNYNSANGANALYSNTEGYYNVANGYQALNNNTTGSYNVASGRNALYNNTAGAFNVASGADALYSLTSGSNNVALGYQALYYGGVVTNTVVVGGNSALGVNGSTAFVNGAFLGYASGQGITTGNNNTFVGAFAGDSVTSGANNTIIGYNADAPTATTSNWLNLANAISGSTSGGMTFIGGIKANGIVTATYFEGDGSRLTGIAGGTPSEIVSNTTRVSTRSTGYISITTNGTTTGYFDTAGRLAVPGISVTTMNGVSSTSGYFSGNVGIGVTNPAWALSVSGTTLTTALTVSSVTPSITMDAYANGGTLAQLYFRTPTNGNGGIMYSGGLIFQDTVNNVDMVISNAGKVGIGNSSPAYDLTIGDGARTTSVTIHLAHSGGGADIGLARSNDDILTGSTNADLVIAQSGATRSMLFGTNGTEKVRITSGGNVGIGSTNPVNTLDLGSSTSGRGIAWGGTVGTFNYANIFAPYSSGGLALAVGLRGGTASDVYYSSTDSSIPRAMIRLGRSGDPGMIRFFTDAAAAIASNTQVTPTERMRITNGGLIGIGTQTPTVALEVSGTVSATRFVGDGSGLTGLSTVGDRIVSGTSNAYISPNGTVTVRGLLDIMSGNSNVGVGYHAAESATGNYGTALGVWAGTYSDGDYQTAIGYGAGEFSSNTVVTAVGALAGQYSKGTYMTGLGHMAARYSSGSLVTALGAMAGTNNTRSYATLVGYNAGNTNTADALSAFGYSAGANNSGAHTTLLGYGAGTYNAGNFVTSAGSYSAQFNTGGNVVAVGYTAAQSNTAINVTAVGTQAGKLNTYSNVTLLGYNAQADKANQVVLGNGSVAEVSTTGVYMGSGLSVSGPVTGTNGVFTGNVAVGGGAPLAAQSLRVQGKETGAANQTRLDLYNNATLFIKPHSTNSTNMNFGTIGSGAAVGVQVTNGGGVAAWPIVLNPFGGSVGVGFITPTAALEVSGTVSATRFVGDGSGLTGIASGSGSEIASGTTKVSTNSNGYISLTTGGVTTGYFDTSGRLVVPSVSTTNPASLFAMTGSFSGNVIVSPSLGFGGYQINNAYGLTALGLASVAGHYSNFSQPGDSILRSTSGSVPTGDDNNLILTARTASGAVLFGTGEPDTEKMRITSGGNVGIGTTAPSSSLHVMGDITLGGSDSRLIRFRNADDSDHASLGEYNGGLALSGQSGINTAGLVHVFIANNGNVGISNTAPGYKLDVAGQVAGAGAFVNTSDARLKKDVTPIAYGLDAVMKLRPVGFNWIDQGADWKKQHQVGLIAQEVELVIPEVVTAAKDASRTRSIAYGELVPVLIKAVQDLKGENIQLQAENDQLKTDMKAMHDLLAKQGQRLDALEKAPAR